MDITFEDFRRSCPASSMPDETVFESITEYFETAKNAAVKLMSPMVFERLDSVEPSDADFDTMQQLRADSVAFICSLAFYEAVPQIDLVLTPNGFGVVSNQNLAPASADRVEKLRTELRRTVCARLDSMLSYLRLVESWHGSQSCLRYFDTLFWHSDHIKVIAGALATRDDLVAAHGKISTAELKVAQLISPEQLAELRRLEATAKASPTQSMAIQFCRNYVVALLCDHNSLELHRRTLLGFVEQFPDVFRLYHSSQTYRANHFEHYQNEKDASCFFFG